MREETERMERGKDIEGHFFFKEHAMLENCENRLIYSGSSEKKTTK